MPLEVGVGESRKYGCRLRATQSESLRERRYGKRRHLLSAGRVETCTEPGRQREVGVLRGHFAELSFCRLRRYS